MQKQIPGTLQPWKKRWLVLKKTKLYYYKSDEEKKKIGSLSLVHPAEIKAVNEINTIMPSKKYISISVPGKCYHLVTNSDDELKHWTTALNACLVSANLKSIF